MRKNLKPRHMSRGVIALGFVAALVVAFLVLRTEAGAPVLRVVLPRSVLESIGVPPEAPQASPAPSAYRPAPAPPPRSIPSASSTLVTGGGEEGPSEEAEPPRKSAPPKAERPRRPRPAPAPTRRPVPEKKTKEQREQEVVSGAENAREAIRDVRPR